MEQHSILDVAGAIALILAVFTAFRGAIEATAALVIVGILLIYLG